MLTTEQFVVCETSRTEIRYLNYDADTGYPYTSKYLRDTFTKAQASDAVNTANCFDIMKNPRIYRIALVSG